MSIRRLTPKQLLLALAIAAALLGAGALAIFVLDQRAKAAVTAEDVFAAIGQGDMTRVIECLKARPQLANARDAKGRTPLHLAAERNMADTTRLLLKMGEMVPKHIGRSKKAAAKTDAAGGSSSSGGAAASSSKQSSKKGKKKK